VLRLFEGGGEMLCKHCGSEDAVKNGIILGKQRYKCKGCGKTYREGDDRERYTNDQRLRVIKWYLEGAGIMSIERMEGVPNPLIIKWIRRFGTILRNKMNEARIPDDIRDIQILELDEMFTYCKKNATASTFGLLLIGSEVRLLTLK
jgi:transposase-like protein